MGKREREKRLKRAKEREAQKLHTPHWSQRSPFWMVFLYRFAISFLVILPIAFIGYWIYSSSQNQNMDNKSKSGSSTAIISTDFGNITLTLYDNDAPKTVDNFKKLANKGYYNGILFHRIMQDFMIQAGDPNCSNPTQLNQCGAGGTSAWGDKFADEINAKSLGLSDKQIKDLESQGYQYQDGLKSHKVEVGSIAMANAGPNTNGSQFFIVTKEDQPHLNGKHTVFGKVTDGMNVVSAIAAVKVDPEDNKPYDDVKIKSIKIK